MAINNFFGQLQLPKLGSLVVPRDYNQELKFLQHKANVVEKREDFINEQLKSIMNVTPTNAVEADYLKSKQDAIYQHINDDFSIGDNYRMVKRKIIDFTTDDKVNTIRSNYKTISDYNDTVTKNPTKYLASNRYASDNAIITHRDTYDGDITRLSLPQLQPYVNWSKNALDRLGKFKPTESSYTIQTQDPNTGLIHESKRKYTAYNPNTELAIQQAELIQDPAQRQAAIQQAINNDKQWVGTLLEKTMTPEEVFQIRQEHAMAVGEGQTNVPFSQYLTERSQAISTLGAKSGVGSSSNNLAEIQEMLWKENNTRARMKIQHGHDFAKIDYKAKKDAEAMSALMNSGYGNISPGFGVKTTDAKIIVPNDPAKYNEGIRELDKELDKLTEQLVKAQSDGNFVDVADIQQQIDEKEADRAVMKESYIGVKKAVIDEIEKGEDVKVYGDEYMGIFNPDAYGRAWARLTGTNSINQLYDVNVKYLYDNAGDYKKDLAELTQDEFNAKVDKMAQEKAKSLYGDNIPEQYQQTLDNVTSEIKANAAKFNRSVERRMKSSNAVESLTHASFELVPEEKLWDGKKYIISPLKIMYDGENDKINATQSVEGLITTGGDNVDGLIQATLTKSGLKRSDVDLYIAPTGVPHTSGGLVENLHIYYKGSDVTDDKNVIGTMRVLEENPEIARQKAQRVLQSMSVAGSSPYDKASVQIAGNLTQMPYISKVNFRENDSGSFVTRDSFDNELVTVHYSRNTQGKLRIDRVIRNADNYEYEIPKATLPFIENESNGSISAYMYKFFQGHYLPKQN